MSRNDQLHHRRKAATRSSLERRTRDRSPNQRILIVCEGEQTEPRYFRSLVDSLKIPFVEVEICFDCASAPIRVVEYAKRKAVIEGRPEDGGYNSIFCVFDRDNHETYEKAKSELLRLSKMKEFGKVKFLAITSTPCVEYWFILHFSYSRRPIVGNGAKSPGEMAVTNLKKISEFKDYSKTIGTMQIAALLDRTPQAIKNAHMAMADSEKTGEENPSTLMHLVVEHLHEAKRSADLEAAKSR